MRIVPKNVVGLELSSQDIRSSRGVSKAFHANVTKKSDSLITTSHWVRNDLKIAKDEICQL
jgi:hypothetical protein